MTRDTWRGDQDTRHVQVAGGTGRIVVSDFWDYDGPDEFQLESYGPNL